MKTPTLDDRLAARLAPTRSPVMFQTWSDLLFLHWEIDPDLIQARLPPGLTVDLHQGKTYLGLVPFIMKNVRPRFLPAVPWLSHFLELNVRAYVHDSQGRPGVWFFSLDCNQPIAVEIARKFFHLPYQHAQMSLRDSLYSCRRRSEKTVAQFQSEPTQAPTEATPGSLEFFLLERYYLFSHTRSGHLYLGQVHHPPYPFSPAHLTQWDPAPLHWENFPLNSPPISALTSHGVDVSIYPLSRI